MKTPKQSAKFQKLIKFPEQINTIPHTISQT